MGSEGAAVDVPVKNLSDPEAQDMFDRICQREMQITGGEFLRRWDAGEYDTSDVDSVPGLADVAMALPLVREA